MDETLVDFVACVRRFARLDDAIELGSGELAARPRAQVAAALTDVCVEAVRVAEVGLRVAADDDLWPVLGGAVRLWDRLAELLDTAEAANAPTPVDIDGIRAVARQLLVVRDHAIALERRLEELTAYPADDAADAAVRVAARDLSHAGDRLVVLALDTHGTLRLDAAVAVLMAAAAASGRADRRRAGLRET